MGVKYNETQLEAINSNHNKILVLACAGAGKSTTLVGRAARLIKDGVHPSSILCLTFTNKAGAEMREKFKRMFPKIAPVPEFRTFHAFCYSLIVKDPDVRAAIGYSKIPSIASDAIVKEAKETAKLQTKVMLPDDILNGKEPCPQRDKMKLETWKKAYRRYLARLDVITFDIMSDEISRLFTSKHVSVEKYKKQYTHIMVDEFQDTDGIQFKFVGSFTNASWFLVGDALQQLYAFRGTSNKFIKMLSVDDTWQKIRMNENYRSTQEICEFANKMSTYASNSYRIELHGQHSGLPVTVKSGGITSYNHPVYLQHLMDIVKKLDVCRNESAAILCRTNNEVNFVINYLGQQNIACTNSKKQTLIIPLIKAAGDIDFELEYLASILTKNDYDNWIKLSYTKDYTVDEFLELFDKSQDVRRAHKKIESIRQILATSEDAVSKASLILKKFNIVGVRCNPEESTSESIISALVDAIESFEESSLYVGTIHSAKGLEYNTVFIIGVNQGVWELNCEDNLNLYYVAITRAKEHLFVYTA